MATDETLSAVEIGYRKAEEVIAFRDRELRQRTKAIAASPRVAAEPEAVAEAVMAAAGPQGIATLVAEGDSWFDYPLHDVLRYLEDRHGYDVESAAHAGDSVEQMAYSNGQLEEFLRRIEKLARRGVVPRAVVLSGGGNDLAGPEFAMLLNHVDSSIAGLSDAVLRGVIDERLRTAYVVILSSVTRACESRLGRTLPIVVHGYDYPVPDGRGVGGVFGFLPGPWLEPGFRAKGFARLEERRALCVVLIDRFNRMLAEVVAIAGFEHVHHLDLRGTLTSANYKADWANELHPSPKGFETVAKRFATLIAGLP
ncbi:MAG: hypothetical protein QOI56_633 [Actinomycetota bacterium]|jgi:hypothetical protein|nr:hypothetical protein [Actinomycetota bacterium]